MMERGGASWVRVGREEKKRYFRSLKRDSEREREEKFGPFRTNEYIYTERAVGWGRPLSNRIFGNGESVWLL